MLAYWIGIFAACPRLGRLSSVADKQEYILARLAGDADLASV
jgi:hypothetical protein